MSKEAASLKLKKAYLFPQDRKWIRVFESVILILCSFMVTYQIIFWRNYYNIKLQSENFYWVSVFCYLIVAYCFYIKTSFPKIGRLAILLIVLFFSAEIGSNYVSEGIEIFKEKHKK